MTVVSKYSDPAMCAAYRRIVALSILQTPAELVCAWVWQTSVELAWKEAIRG